MNHELRSVLVTMAAVLTLAAMADAQPLDPEKIRGAEVCGECHVSAFAVWKKTTHQRGFRTLHRKDAAEAIAKRMGFRLLKRGSLCLDCHYTPTVRDGERRAISGVSCESCHGAGRDWIDVHNEYGGRGVDHTGEDPAHRAQRIEASREAGMRRASDDLYGLMSSCFGCHTVSNEKLVNVGGHGTGSGDFELVVWTEGEIRHNFLDSFLDGDGTVNAERPMAHKRVLYVLGRALALEHGLRAMAEAEEQGIFAKAASRRIRGAVRDLRSLQRRLDLPELASMIATIRALEVGPNKRSAMLAAAEAIGAASRRFLGRNDGQALASLDPVLLGTAADATLADLDDDEAAPETLADAALPSTALPAAGEVGSAAGDIGVPGGDVVPAAAQQAQTIRREAIPAVGAFKRRVRARSKHPVLGPDQCTSCHRHQEQTAWWFDDPHSIAADPFFDQAPKNVKIATLYGLKRTQIARGDQVCMDCHGTVVSGQAREEVADGVGCESCHGAAGAYVEPHQAGDPSLGTERPGYREALDLGMVEVKNLNVRGTVCTGCHYVTEPRLISAGHPSGIDFDYARGMEQIKHWEHASAPAGQIQAAFRTALGSRGAVPDVQRARLAEVITTAVALGEAGVVEDPSGVVLAGARPRRPRRRVERPNVPRPRPWARTSPGRRGSLPELDLPAFPEIDDDTSIEAALLLLKRRLVELYRAVGEGATTPGETR